MIAPNDIDPLVQRSALLAKTLVQESLPERWQHTSAVADRVEHRRSAGPFIPTNTPNSFDPAATGFTFSG